MAHPSDAGGRGTRESRSLADPWSFPIDAHEFRLSVGVNVFVSPETLPSWLEASVHNVIVETTDETVKAYLSWYWDGMLVLDVTDPYNPKETARYFDNSPEFLASPETSAAASPASTDASNGNTGGGAAAGAGLEET